MLGFDCGHLFLHVNFSAFSKLNALLKSEVTCQLDIIQGNQLKKFGGLFSSICYYISLIGDLIGFPVFIIIFSTSIGTE